jgi:hypothetical protein
VKPARRAKITPRRVPAPRPAARPAKKPKPALAAVPAAQVALPGSGDTDSDQLPGAEILLSAMVIASILLLALASLPRTWTSYGPTALSQVVEQRGRLAVVGFAIPLGIAMGYLVVLLE